jgi:hypothetical protein
MIDNLYISFFNLDALVDVKQILRRIVVEPPLMIPVN